MNYGQQQQYGAPDEEMAPPDLKFKFNIGTQEIREIVAVLNQEPFNESFTMVNPLPANNS